MRAEPVGQADRHAPPRFDEEFVLGVIGVVLGDGVALVEAVFVMQGSAANLSVVGGNDLRVKR